MRQSYKDWTSELVAGMVVCIFALVGAMVLAKFTGFAIILLVVKALVVIGIAAALYAAYAAFRLSHQ